MKRILTIFGTRPEALKLWPILKLGREEYAESLEFKTYFTNQSEEQYIPDIRPDWSARSCCGTRLAKGFGQLVSDLEWMFNNHNHWDAVMVQGDTFSTLAGAQAAYFRDIPVIHVEAGLRTYRKTPWPEEMIRRQVDGMSKFHFCPTDRAREFLLRELCYGNEPMGIIISGQPLTNLEYVQMKKQLEKAHGSLAAIRPIMLSEEMKFQDIGGTKLMPIVSGNTIIDRIEMEPDTWDLPSFIPQQYPPPHILITLHRRESWDRFEGIMMGYLIRMIEQMQGYQFLFLIHPNNKFSPSGWARKNASILPAQDYKTTLAILRRCAAVITDSGGLIEEAAYFRKPCFILRDETERRESIDAGLAKLMGRDRDISAIPHLMEHLEDWFGPEAPCPYGDGRASRRILDCLSDEANWG